MGVQKLREPICFGCIFSPLSAPLTPWAFYFWLGALRTKEGPRGHTFFMWPTSDCLGTQGPLEFALFLLNAPPRTPRRPVVGHIVKKVCPSGRLIAPIGLLRRAWLQPRQKARLQNRFQSNNNRFKLLLPQPSLLQLRLTILTKQGCEECSRGTLLLQ